MLLDINKLGKKVGILTFAIQAICLLDLILPSIRIHQTVIGQEYYLESGYGRRGQYFYHHNYVVTEGYKLELFQEVVDNIIKYHRGGLIELEVSPLLGKCRVITIRAYQQTYELGRVSNPLTYVFMPVWSLLAFFLIGGARHKETKFVSQVFFGWLLLTTFFICRLKQPSLYSDFSQIGYYPFGLLF